MKDSDWLCIYFLAVGIICCVMAIQFKLGKMKAGFLPVPLNTEIPRYWLYGLIPVGVGSLLTCLGIQLGNRPLILIGIVGFSILGLVFMAWKPRWLEPKWMTWLRDRYDRPMLEYMFSQAAKDRSWAQRVATQEGLEAWAKKMEEQYPG